MPKHSLPRIAYRLVSGRPLDGRDGYPYSTSGPGRLAGWQRQALRLGVPAAGVGVHSLYAAAPTYTAAAAATLAAVGGTRGVRELRRTWRTRRFRAVYIRPTVATLQKALGVGVRLDVDTTIDSLAARLARPMSPAEQAARAWYGRHVEPALRWLPDRVWRAEQATRKRAEPLIAPLRRPREDTAASIRLVVDAPYITADDRKLIGSVIHAKIPVGDLIETADMIGEKVTMRWTVRRQPPAGVGLDDIAAHIDAVGDDEFVLGLGTGATPVVISLADDSPHIAVSAGSGAGKSVLAQLLAAQVLRRGGRVTILDIKGSHKWARNVPGITYCTTPERMHDALIWHADYADRNNKAAFEADDDFDPGPRHLLILEELNATIGLVADHWADVREKGDPKLSPAIKALRFVLYTGRSAKVNVLAIAQSLTARAIGGPEARENFAIRCLARYSANAWKMLVPQAAMPRASRALGRWAIVIGDRVTMTQVAYLTPAQVRVLARVTETPKIPEARLGSDVTDNSNVIDPLSAPTTLEDAIDEGLIPWSLGATKMRLSRGRKSGSSVPKPIGRKGRADTYRRDDLIVWAESERVS